MMGAQEIRKAITQGCEQISQKYNLDKVFIHTCILYIKKDNRIDEYGFIGFYFNSIADDVEQVTFSINDTSELMLGKLADQEETEPEMIEQIEVLDRIPIIERAKRLNQPITIAHIKAYFYAKQTIENVLLRFDVKSLQELAGKYLYNDLLPLADLYKELDKMK